MAADIDMLMNAMDMRMMNTPIDHFFAFPCFQHLDVLFSFRNVINYENLSIKLNYEQLYTVFIAVQFLKPIKV